MSKTIVERIEYHFKLDGHRSYKSTRRAFGGLLLRIPEMDVSVSSSRRRGGVSIVRMDVGPDLSEYAHALAAHHRPLAVRVRRIYLHVANDECRCRSAEVGRAVLGRYIPSHDPRGVYVHRYLRLPQTVSCKISDILYSPLTRRLCSLPLIKLFKLAV